MIFTQEQINEIKQRLSLSGIKDSELDKLNLLEHPITGKEVITIVKDGENLRISVEDLYEEFAKYIEQSENKEDFFNVSVYLGRLDPEFENAAKPCTLEEAINVCPPYIRRAGQTISFLDSHDMKWETYQYIGTEDDDWGDITLFENYNQVLQDQINAIISDKAVVNLTATPSLVFVNEATNIILEATTNTAASKIDIISGGQVIATGSGTSLSHTDSGVTFHTASTKTYTAQFIIKGLGKITTKSVTAVNKIYYGSGTTYTDATTHPSPKTSAAGSYIVTVNDNGDYVFFNIPATMTINRATMNGFDFPLENPNNVIIDGVTYKSYKSSNTYDAGTYQIVIS